MKTCSRCGLGHDDSAPRCRACGAQLQQVGVAVPTAPPPTDEQVRLCPRCGLANPASSPFCRDCSASLGDVRPVSENDLLAEKMAAQEKRDHRYGEIRTASLVVCGVMALTVVVLAVVLGTPEILFSLLMFGSAAVAIAFPRLDFTLRTMFIADTAEPSEFYYVMNYVGAGACIVLGFLLLFFTI